MEKRSSCVPNAVCGKVKESLRRPRAGWRAAGAVALFAGFALTAFCQQPVVRWSFDGGAATNSGSGGSMYDATLYGSVAFTNGIDGGGLCFLGGSQGYAKLSYTLSSQGTVAFWYKPSRFFDFNSLFDNSVDPNKWEMWIAGDGMLNARTGLGTTGRAAASLNADLRGTNRWFHIAFTWDRYATTNQTRLYINGDEQARGNFSSWDEPGSAVYFGGHTGNTPAEGVMDDVRVYDVALTAAQAQAVQAEVASRVPAVRITLDGAVTNSGTGGAKYDAALRGDPVWTNGWNNKGQALALNGTNDFVSVPYRLSTSGSIALWYYVPGPWYNYNSVFDNSVDANHYECWIDGTGGLRFRTASWQSQAGYGLGSGSNRWYHIVGTWDALSSNIVLYVNGVERGRAVNTNGVAWPAAGANFFIGGGNAGNTNGTGIASDLQIFETPLTSNRVDEVYKEFRRRGKLVAYVPFDGSAVDVAGSNAVVLSGSPVYVKTQGGLLKGLNCRGTGTVDYASISNVLGSSVGTIALWYYARGPWYNYQTVIDNSSNADRWESWIYSDGRLAFRVSGSTGGGTVIYDLDNLQGPDNWYHIAYVWDRAEQLIRLYVNGDLRMTAALTDAGWFAPSPTLSLAGGNAGNTKGNGVWDEVRVYDRALTEPEIEALMVIPPPPPPKGTLITVW